MKMMAYAMCFCIDIGTNFMLHMYFYVVTSIAARSNEQDIDRFCRKTVKLIFRETAYG